MPITAFLTDSTLCIGCKACEVACKEWNGVPDDGFTFTGFSYDNTAGLGHSTWRHVKFIERGETGDASACHLHFEMWAAPGWYEGGSPIDPLSYLEKWDRYS